MQESPSKETLVVFRQVWEPASSISELKSINPASAREAARTLESIHSALVSTPHPELHLTQPIIAHLHKALFRLLGLCTGFFVPEKRFDFLMDPWCKCLGFLLQLEDGYDLILASDWRADLTLFNVLLRIVLGYEPANKKPTSQPPTPQQNVDPTTTPKDRMSDETRLLAVQCLIHALPLDENAPGIHDLAQQQQQDGVIADNSRALSSSGLVRWRTKSDQWVRDHLLGPDRQSRETFASLLCILPDTVKNAQLVALRVAALDGLMKLLRCLETPERMGNNFPGLIFRLDAAAKERGLKEHHTVLTRMLDIWTFMVVLSLKGLASTAPKLKPNGDGLAEDLMSMYNSAKGTSHASSSSSAPKQSDMDYGTDAWLAAMAKGLRLHFKDISPLRTHAHWMVRLKFGEMAFNILKDCRRSIKRLGGGRATTVGVTGFLLETLIGCTLDDYSEVSRPAREYLRQLTEEYESTDLINMAKEILRERLMALPRVLHGVDEALKQSSVRLVQGMILFLGRHMENMVNHQTLVGYIQPWINLLMIEQLDQHNMDERGGILGDGTDGAEDTDTGSSDVKRWSSWVQSRKGSGRKFGFPRRIHHYLREQATSTAFTGLLRQLGSTTEIDVWTEEMTTRLRQDCQSVRESQGWFDARTVSSVLLLNQVLLGAYGIGLATFGKVLTTEQSTKSKASSTRKQLRHTRRAAKGVLEEYLEILVACSQMSLEAQSRQAAQQRADPSLDAEKDSRTKKALLAKMFGADDDELFDMDVGAEALIYDYNVDVMLKCLLLEGIASIAVILGSEDFEMELYRTLYILLEHLGDQDSALVRDTAEACLEHVAFVCQYESIGDLIQANYDYVIQQVSQRIVFLGANPKTPQVLCALIRVVGPPAIAMLEDSVTEIFEALDHWKSQEDQVGEGLLKSLCEIVHVMALAVETASVPSTADQKNGSESSKRDSGILIMMPGMRFSHSDKASVEVAEFARKYRILIQEMSGGSQAEADALEEEMSNMTPDQIRDYFLRLTKDAEQERSTLTGDTPAETAEDLMEKMMKEAAGEESLSLDELRDAIPKPPPKDAEPEPPTKHQQLCLRILDKAGYFLTSDSPRMRILALEAIQRAIVVLRDRPTELHPAIHALWPAMVSRVLMRRSHSMEMFYVSLKAIEVVTVLAENCSEFLSRHLMDDVWPFILKALQSWTQKPATADRAHRRTPVQTITASRGSGGRAGQPMRSQGRRAASSKVFTREHRLQMTTLTSLSKIVRK
ncbi:TEL2-interacting protein 1, partial [Mortierella alpina]